MFGWFRAERWAECITLKLPVPWPLISLLRAGLFTIIVKKIRAHPVLIINGLSLKWLRPTMREKAIKRTAKHFKQPFPLCLMRLRNGIYQEQRRSGGGLKDQETFLRSASRRTSRGRPNIPLVCRGFGGKMWQIVKWWSSFVLYSNTCTNMTFGKGMNKNLSFRPFYVFLKHVKHKKTVTLNIGSLHYSIFTVTQYNNL